MKNCLVYDSYETLQEAIEISLTRPLEDICRMKAEVISYYDEYIATEQVIKQINAFLNSERETMNIAVPFLNEHKS